MDFWRSEAYSKFFDYLDSTGGFYYEVRIVALALRACPQLTGCRVAMGRRPSA